jgi:hypothetical protein
MSQKKITKFEFSDESSEVMAEIVVSAKTRKNDAQEPLYITRV